MNLMYGKLLLEIKARYKQVVGIKEKIEFLIDERGAFRAKNTDDDAKIIAQWFTDEIEKVKTLSQFENKSDTLKSKIPIELSKTKNKNLSEEYELSIRIFKKATKEDAKCLNIEINDEFSIIPEPKDKEQLLERFEKLHTQRYFEALQRSFTEKYGEGNAKTIKDELSEIQTFIDKANKLSTTETFKNNNHSESHEFSRLANGYYKNPNLVFHPYSFFNNEAVSIYAKYFLYKKWLEEKLNITKPKSKPKRLFEINDELIDNIRTNLGTIHFIFNKSREETEIVPNELTHAYLFRNFRIDDEILEYYCLPNKYLLSNNEFQRMVDSGYFGRKETALYPYSVIILGAYYSRSDITTKLIGLKVIPHNEKINKEKIEYLSDLLPYFKKYSNGFEEGFNKFDDQQIKPFLTMFSEKKDYIDKVFDYLTRQLLFRNNWGVSSNGFTSNQDNEIVDAFKNGQIQGYYYRAWSIVFSNNNLFAPLFQEHLNVLTSKQTKMNSERLKIDQIALIYFYNGKQITRKNGNEIAKQYNHNSGEKLFQRYTYYSSTSNRKGKPTPCTPKKLKNKIELFENIVPYLTGTSIQRANDEIQILKTIFENEYQ